MNAAENKHTLADLHQMQMLSLNAKIAMTKQRIKAWVEEYGEDGVYVSFSGGKDSTVLLTIVRELYPDIPAVFIDTGLEYPEIRDFVRTWDNVEWVKPKLAQLASESRLRTQQWLKNGCNGFDMKNGI